MILRPSYRNGTDPEIHETALDKPLSPLEFLWWSQPRITHTAAEIEAAKMRPITTGKDLYGMRGLKTKAHHNLVENPE